MSNNDNREQNLAQLDFLLGEQHDRISKAQEGHALGFAAFHSAPESAFVQHRREPARFEARLTAWPVDDQGRVTGIGGNTTVAPVVISDEDLDLPAGEFERALIEAVDKAVADIKRQQAQGPVQPDVAVDQPDDMPEAPESEPITSDGTRAGEDAEQADDDSEDDQADEDAEPVAAATSDQVA